MLRPLVGGSSDPSGHISHRSLCSFLEIAQRSKAAIQLTVGDRVNLGSLPGGLVCLEATFGIDEVACKESVDQGALSETGLTDDHDIELETALEELSFDLLGDAVEAHVGLQRCVLLVDGGHFEDGMGNRKTTIWWW